ncbi:MAG TPA: DsbA family protein [Dongiaceae bacterium]|nr:DsbA family protein [Dongiaceae bacterium]
MKSIDFYYSIGSRYSYLAHSRMAGLERDFGVAVRWRPLDSAALMKAVGRTPFAGPPPSTQYDPGYRSIDAERWARFYGIPYREPDWARIDFARVNMAVVAAADQADPQAYSRALFALAFERGARAIDDAALRAAADSAGLDAARLIRDIDAEETAARHHATIEAALAAGVFGVPSFVIGTQMYWGNDRIALLRHHLAETR